MNKFLGIDLKRIKERLKEKDVTPEELEQLQLKYKKAFLKARIAEEKKKERSNSRFSGIITNIQKNTQTTNKEKSKTKTTKKPIKEENIDNKAWELFYK